METIFGDRRFMVDYVIHQNDVSTILMYYVILFAGLILQLWSNPENLEHYACRKFGVVLY